MHLHLVGLHIGDTAPIIAALRAAHPHVQWSATSVVHGQGGASYETLARECRATARLRDGSPLALMTAWEGLRAQYHVPAADGYILASWSAGYGYTRELLRVEGRPADVVAVVALDSIYAGLGADGQPLAADLTPWVALAEEAVAGGVAFAVGASAIDYMESLPHGQRYASTGRVADAIAHELGLAPAGSRRVSTTAGSLVLAHYPGQDAAAHVAAVRGWGPALVVEAARLWLGEHGGASTEPPPSTVPAPPPERPPPSTSHDLSEGARGADVAAMQRLAGCRADGTWGPVTTRAVAALQRSVGLPVRPRWGEAERRAREALARGVDVSHHQPPIDWERVRQAGYSWCVVRAAYGSTPDRRAAEHWRDAGAAGLARMGYLFLRPGLTVAGQVDAALDTLPECRGWWLDVEQDPATPERRHTRAEVDAALSLLGRAGRVGVYSARWWWDACQLGPCGAPLWLAGPSADALPGAWDRWTAWQTDVGPVPGVVGDCDRDVWGDLSTLPDWGV